MLFVLFNILGCILKAILLIGFELLELLVDEVPLVLNQVGLSISQP